jgi:hypothetical protein
MSNVEAIKSLLELLIDLGAGSTRALGDGEVSLSDLRFFKNTAKSMFKLLREYDDIAVEISDLSVDELEEIATFVAAKLQREYDEVAYILEDALKFFELILAK